MASTCSLALSATAALSSDAARSDAARAELASTSVLSSRWDLADNCGARKAGRSGGEKRKRGRRREGAGQSRKGGKEGGGRRLEERDMGSESAAER